MILTEDLRLSILQSAVEGKLTEQSAKDTPVETTLDRLQDIKNNLANNKKIKKAASKTEDSIPFNIPDNWTWVKLCDIGELARGKSKHRPRNDESLYIDGTIPMIQTGDVAAANKYITQFNTCYNEKGLAQSRLWKKGTLCITIAANIGDVAILTFDACFPDSVLGFLPFSEQVSKEYVYYMLLAYKHRMNAKASKMAQSNLSLDKINSMLFPFPPIEEQLRIVDCLDMLFCKVDEYEKIEQQLSTLKEEFFSNMCNAILQSAMQGKLTLQLETDSSVDNMLQLIIEDKKSYIGKKTTKADSRMFLELDENEEFPFDIPDNWKWCKLGYILRKLTDGTHKTPNYTSSGIRFVSVKDISSGFINFSNTKFISQEEHSLLYQRCNPECGDMLLSKVGTTGVPAYVDTTEEFSLFVSVALLKFNHQYILPRFLYYLIYSPLVQKQALEQTKGVGNQNWVLDKIANTLVVLPPIEEQQRIVERLDVLLPLCSNLAD